MIHVFKLCFQTILLSILFFFVKYVIHINKIFYHSLSIVSVVRNYWMRGRKVYSNSFYRRKESFLIQILILRIYLISMLLFDEFCHAIYLFIGYDNRIGDDTFKIYSILEEEYCNKIKYEIILFSHYFNIVLFPFFLVFSLIFVTITYNFIFILFINGYMLDIRILFQNFYIK